MTYKKALKWFNNYLMFFILTAFVTSCCMSVFVTIFSKSTGVELNSENLNLSAKLTFANVLLVSMVITAIDGIRRKFSVTKPANRIIKASEKIIEGDYSVRVPRVSSIFVDDEFKAIGECFNKMAQELDGVETLRTDFVANVSHEMKTPLAVMQNYATLLQTENLSDEKRVEYAKGIFNSSKRLSDMMTNILKLNRLENQQIYPKKDRFDLAEQLAEELLLYENVWEQKEINIETDFAENVEISADYELLSLVWNNLFSNAFKFTPQGGSVKISLEADESYATVKVTDTGCGMTSEVGKHIFEKFYQGDASHSAQGNGLGLALVKRVVDILKGEISVESTLGEGSTFTVKIRRT